MAQPQKRKDERRRVERIALRLTATMRDGTRSRVKVRVIDMSIRGCRIECSSTLTVNSGTGLSFPGPEPKFSRAACHCQEFVGLGFKNHLPTPWFGACLAVHKHLPRAPSTI